MLKLAIKQNLFHYSCDPGGELLLGFDHTPVKGSILPPGTRGGFSIEGKTRPL
jgi:hypothetical protein